MSLPPLARTLPTHFSAMVIVMALGLSRTRRLHGWYGREGYLEGCRGSKPVELPELQMKDVVWEAGSLDMVVSLPNLKVWVVDLSILDLVRRLLSSPNLRR